MVCSEDLFKKVKNKVEPIVKNNNLDLVDFKIFPRGRRWVIRSIVDHKYGGVTIDECSKLNKIIFSAVDNLNILGDDFVIEVNSPGLDRPLENAGDFMRVKGRVIMVWLRKPLRDKVYFEGELLDVRNSCIALKIKEDTLEISLNIINKALQKII